jgi:hypothetical protein
MKSILKIIVAALAISAVSFAMAANPAKDSGGKKGWQNFCSEFKKTCNGFHNKGSAEYTEGNVGTDKHNCKCLINTFYKDALHDFDKNVCERHGLKHSAVISGLSAQMKMQGGGSSTCYVNH